MKANELRLGNWVKRYTQPNGFIINHNSISRMARGYSDEYDPIPLTEQWLKDFGLKTYTKSSYNMAMGTIIITHPQSMQFVAGLDDLSGEFTVQIDLRYVHQLQNLYFALTGKELEKK